MADTVFGERAGDVATDGHFREDPGCPSRGRRYEPLRKQSRFEGSFRQRRAQALKLVAAAPQPRESLEPQVVDALERDGLVELQNGLVALPD